MHNDDDAFLEFDIRRTYIVFARGNARTAHASHGIHSEMKVDAVDIIVIAAIVSSCYYTWDKHTRDYVWAVEYTAEDDDAEGAAREIVTHPSRNCNASGEKALIVILELTYSGSRPIETTDADVLGEEIMKNLFSVCCRFIIIVTIYK